MIALAPLTYIDGAPIVNNYNAFFDTFDSSDINVVYGPNWVEDYKLLCMKGSEACTTLSEQVLG